jgi:hypothetical protein
MQTSTSKFPTPGPGTYDIHSSFEKFDNLVLSALNGPIDFSRAHLTKSSLENPMKQMSLMQNLPLNSVSREKLNRTEQS